MKKQDILIFFSDQHTGYISGYAGDKIVRTPNLDRIAAQGTVFENAYTTCPLCVPARMSMLTGQLPSKTGIFDNSDILDSDYSTFLHALGAEGYETVLCGRMHFVGADQRHGFTKRIFGDITAIFRGASEEKIRNSRGIYEGTLGEPHCLEIIGGGNSPTLEYDRHVINAALEYLSADHDKPQCVVVGTYAPHFPYVAPPELFEYYLDKVKLPESITTGCNYEYPPYASRPTNKSEEIIRATRAAYYGMIEFNDTNVGLVYDKWNEYLARNNREGMFVYVSDHGDHCGDRGLYGKKSFFEPSAHIPLIFQGSGVPQGVKIKSPASIIDIGPTLCELAETAPPPEQDGKSLLNQIHAGQDDDNRFVITEFILKSFGRMVRMGKYKLITYHGYEEYDLLFDIEADPNELTNIAADNPEILVQLRKLAAEGCNPDEIKRKHDVRNQHIKLKLRWAKQQDFSETDVFKNEQWLANSSAATPPEKYLKGSLE